MTLRNCLGIGACILIFCLNTKAQSPNVKEKKIETCAQCYGLILQGQLIDTLEFSKCEAISGMTCHIRLKDGGRLPSRVFVQPLDSKSHPLGKKLLLIYPELKPKEGGKATFPSRIPNATKIVVLEGEWNGPYKSAY
jgi:hypothetical protein